MRRSLAVAVLMTAAFARIAAADYLESYRRGFNAFNLFRWERAVTEMRKAIEENPNESEKVHIQLLTWKPYVPHFYLGISLAKLGRCTEAVPALRESLRQGVLPDTNGFRGRALRTLENCPAAASEAEEPEETVASPPPAARTASPRLDTAPALEPANNPLPVRPPANPESAPVAGPETSTGAAGIVVPGNPAQTGSQADVRALAESRETLRAAVERARRVLLSVPRDAVSREASALREGIRRSDPDLVEPARLSSATRDISIATANVERWLRERVTAAGQPPEPPAALVAAVDAYLRGDYAAALRILDGTEFGDERSRRHALLFRAAALHALFVIGHGRDSALQTRAAADLRGYRQLEPRPSLDPRIFSPRFVEFVRQTGL